MQGQGNDILTNNSKAKFPHNPLPLFLRFLPTPLHLKNILRNVLKGFVIFFVELTIKIATPDYMWLLCVYFRISIKFFPHTAILSFTVQTPGALG